MFSLFTGTPSAGIVSVPEGLKAMADAFQRFIEARGDAVVAKLRQQRLPVAEPGVWGCACTVVDRAVCPPCKCSSTSDCAQMLHACVCAHVR